MASMLEAFIAQEMDPQAQLNKQFIAGIMEAKDTQTVGLKAEVIIAISKAKQSPEIENDPAAKEALERLLKRVAQ